MSIDLSGLGLGELTGSFKGCNGPAGSTIYGEGCACEVMLVLMILGPLSWIRLPGILPL
jgi:hypothetical protein